jgi:hypothetical protein
MWCIGSYKHIYLRGRGFDSPWGLFFNLILGRRGMYVGMSAERGNRKDSTWNGSLLFTALISSRDRAFIFF